MPKLSQMIIDHFCSDFERGQSEILPGVKRLWWI